MSDDAFGGPYGYVRELPTEVGDGTVPLELDLSRGAIEGSLTVALRLLPRLGLDASRDLLRVGDHALAFLAGFIKLLLDVCLRLGGLGTRDLGGIQPLGDPLLPVVEHFQDGLVEQQPENDEEQEEVDDLRDELRQIESKGFYCGAHRLPFFLRTRRRTR